MQAPVFRLPLPRDEPHDVRMYYYSACVYIPPCLARCLPHEARADRRRTYLGRTRVPHDRSKAWSREFSHGLGAFLRRLEAAGLVRNRHYVPLCRVWFCITGSKNTPQATWNKPEAAFKLLAARRPGTLFRQNLEAAGLSAENTDALQDLMRRGRLDAARLTEMAYGLLEDAFALKAK